MYQPKLLLTIFCLWLLAAVSLNAQTEAQKKAMASLGSLSNAFEALSEYIAPATVQIFTKGYGFGDGQTTASIIALQRSGGSGVIVDPDGYIVTNYHVVEDADQVQVLLPQKVEQHLKSRSILKPSGKKVDAEIIGVDRETDLAVLKINETNLPYLEFGDSDFLKPGQVVLAFGSPLGLENSVSMGVISSVARQLRLEDPMVYIQTDTPINPGNSGGPLVDTNGRVVGINTFILSQSGGNEGLGFSVPSNIARNIYLQIRSNSRVRRGQIGVHAQTITPVMAAGLKLSRDWGVIIGDVYPNSPAAIAGLKVGDIIFSMDGKLMENGRQFDVNLYRRNLGDKVQLEVLRGDARLNLTVEVIERDDDPDRFLIMTNPKDNLIPRLGILGLDINRRIEEMIPRLRKRFGVLVAAVSAEMPDASGQLFPGDVIFEVNGVEVTGLTSLRGALENLRPGDAAVLQIQRQGRLQYMTFKLDK